jgi:mRNA interferase MazF
MQRGDLYLVQKASRDDPRKQRVHVIVSRQILIDSSYTTVICAPVYTRYDGLSTQVLIGIEEGLKHVSSIHCDELISLSKSRLTRFVGRLRGEKLRSLGSALVAALELENRSPIL